MRHAAGSVTIAGIVIFAVATGAAGAGSTNGTAGAVDQSIPPPLAQNPSIPPLHLSDSDRAKVQQALRAQDTEVSFGLKTAKPAETFNPSVGAAIPASLKPHAFPQPLVQDVPALQRYTYLKFKQQVLIVNPMTRKIADIFPEAQS
jgi:hypothetical protein